MDGERAKKTRVLRFDTSYFVPHVSSVIELSTQHCQPRIVNFPNFLIFKIAFFLFQAYGRMFIGKILHKHVLARNYFSRLPGMAEHMKKKISGQPRGGLPNNGARAAPLRA